MSKRFPEITDAALRVLVEAFYGKVRKDGLIGPLFGAAVEDWDSHLTKLTAFWSQVMLRTGGYSGNPMAAHLKQQSGARPIAPEMFERWLALWDETTGELFAPEAAGRLRQTAERIGQSLSLALFYRPDRVSGAHGRPPSAEGAGSAKL